MGFNSAFKGLNFKKHLRKLFWSIRFFSVFCALLNWGIR